ncbi:MAG TPA: methyl-accepting chemotaxis protein, partial [Woeseiaceae bacterium]
TVLALITAVMLLAAAVVLYFQTGSAAGAASPTHELAALSQAVPLHASNAVAGDERAFGRLESALARLTSLKEDMSELPGGEAEWTNLEQHARAILANRSDIEQIVEASAYVDEHMPQMLEASNALLDVSGATAIVQEFQARAANLHQSLGQLLLVSDSRTLAAAMGEDMDFLKQVTDALAGAESNLDVAALDPGTRDSVLVPIVSELIEMETRVEQARSAAGTLGNPAANVAALSAVATTLFEAVRAPDTQGGGFLTQSWPPFVLVVIALLMLGVLAFMHSRTAVFERASKEQTEQNERNQQAILRLLDELGSLADGDLTVEATVTEDITGAIADSINYAIEKLRELVATINETAIMVDSAAKQTESTAVHMARAAKNQNSEIRAATESIESMASSIEEVSGNAERSSDVARHSVDVAHKGGEAVRRTIDGMNAIRETIQDTSKRIKRLGESSQEIGNIIELINDIAEQTNILALNASIQASMAGEAGRGFAVVADEVQRLAERSTNATKQIEVLVRTIQADTNEAVISMERSTTDVVGGALLAENAGAALDEIEQVSNQIANLVQNISGSAREQASSAADVTRRTARLKEISDQTGKATTATAAAISKLSVLASQLRQTVAGFTLPNSAFEASAFAARKPAPVPQSAPKDKVAG